MKVAPVFMPDAGNRLVRNITHSRGFVKGIYVERDLIRNPPVAVVVHTTGAGPVKRWRASKGNGVPRWKTPFECALWIYGNIMKEGPHYVVGQNKGEIAQICPERFCAWHVGGVGAKPYGSPLDTWCDIKKHPELRWWRERWPSLTSPRDLGDCRIWQPYTEHPGMWVKLHSRHGSANANTIGIEVVPHDIETRLPWSADCWRNVSRLIIDVCGRHFIPIARTRVVSHSDVHPIARTRNGLPWDPSNEQWNWDLFRRFAEPKKDTEVTE